MITDWTYITVPNRVDLSRPLMPLRDGGDNGIYGVDPAWLYEVLCVWNCMDHGTDVSACELPERPSAWFMNLIYERAAYIKRQSTNNFHKSVPSSAFVTMPDPDGVAFGDVPEDVSIGDLVRKTDMSNMFDWMKGVKYVSQSDGVILPAFSWTSSSGQEGNRSADEISPPDASSNTLYKWEWFYYETDGRLSYRNGGAWKRCVAGNFSISIPIYRFKTAWISSAKVYLKIGVNNEDVYVPVGVGTVSASGSSAVVSIDINAAEVAAAAMSALGVSEKAYKTDLETTTDTFHGDPIHTTTGSDLISVTVSNAPIVYIELAPDYRHPLT